MAVELELVLNVEGKNGSVPISGPFPKTFKLTGQKFFWSRIVTLAPTDVDIPVAVPGDGAQTCLLIVVSADVTYELNNDGVARQIKKGADDGGFAIHPGGPNITSVELTGNGSSEAEVYLIRLGQ